jgi:membrane dipeptidase
MKSIHVLLTVVLLLSVQLLGQESNRSDEELRILADKLAMEYIIVDTHVDLPLHLNRKWRDVTQVVPELNMDYPKAVKGGLNAPFMSVWIDAKYQEGGAKEEADTLIDIVEKLVNEYPDKFAAAVSVQDVLDNKENKLISLPMGMENGAPIEDFDDLKYFYDRGIRYVTLTHGKVNHICDSSYDKERKWYGLSPYGKKLISEMNRIGMIIDISHVSDDAFYQVIELTETPVIASHSSCRFFTPGWERNMSDEMIKKLGENGGVIQINFGSEFLDEEIRESSEAYSDSVRRYMAEHHLEYRSPELNEYRKKYKSEHPIGYADVSDVVKHINHVVELVGIDHVGLGSDFDGLGDSLPVGLKDVSMYPNLIYELLKAGYSEEDIEKICSGNFLRVWKEIEQFAENN